MKAISDNELNEMKNLLKKITYYKELLGEADDEAHTTSDEDSEEVHEIVPKKKNYKIQRRAVSSECFGDYNKKADFLCNQCLDTEQSFEHTDEQMEMYRSMHPNWLIYTDGGCRRQGASSFSWIIYAVVQAGSDWVQFCVAFGYTYVEQDQSSFTVEAQGLDAALDIVCKLCYK